MLLIDMTAPAWIPSDFECLAACPFFYLASLSPQWRQLPALSGATDREQRDNNDRIQKRKRPSLLVSRGQTPRRVVCRSLGSSCGPHIPVSWSVSRATVIGRLPTRSQLQLTASSMRERSGNRPPSSPCLPDRPLLPSSCPSSSSAALALGPSDRN